MQKRALALAISSVLCSSVFAQGTDVTQLETVEVSVSPLIGTSVTAGSASGVTKMDVSIKDTPRSIIKFDEEHLETLPVDDVGDVFDYVPGFNRNSSADRRFTARGVTTSISNVLVDGMRTLQGGEAGTGSRFPSTHNAESVTFLRGGDGTIYGQGLGGGLVNIETKKPQAERETTVGVTTRSYISDDTGNFDQNGAALNFSSTGKLTADERVQYRLDAQLSPDRDMFQEGRTETDNFLDAAVTFKVGEKTKITPKLEYGNQERVGGSSYGDGVIAVDGDLSDDSLRGNYYGSPDDFGENTYKQASVRVDHEFNKNWKGFAAIRYKESESDTEDLYVTNSSSPVPNTPFIDSEGRTVIGRKWVKALGDDTYKAFDANVEGKFDVGMTKHHLVAGVNYLDSHIKFYRSFESGSVIADAQNGTGGSPIDVYNPSEYQIVGEQPEWDVSYRVTSDSHLNLYLRDRISLGNVTLIAGAGYAHKDGDYQATGATESTRSSDSGFLYDVGAIYRINKNVNVFANYSREFEFVSSSDIAQYGFDNDYDPVEGHNFEFGVKGDFYDNRLSAGVTLFNLTHENDTSRETINDVSVLVQGSGENSKSKGVEFEVAFRPTKAWTASLSYAYTDSQFLFTNGDAEKWGGSDYAPTHSAALKNKYQFNNNWSVDVGMHYDGTSHDFGSLDDSGAISVRNTFDAGLEVDAGITYQTKKWKARLALDNVFDDSRIVSGTSLQQLKTNDPRSVSLSVDYKF